MTTCGHTFCQLCLPPPFHMGVQPSIRVLLCPPCKEQEKNEVLMAPMPLGPVGKTYCKAHGEKIYFFCENDAEFLCSAKKVPPTRLTPWASLTRPFIPTGIISGVDWKL